MKKLISGLILSSCTLMAIEPYNAFYITAGGGVDFTDSINTSSSTLTYEKPYHWFGAIGYQFKNYKIEIEEIYTQADLYSVSEVKAIGDFTKSTQMLNAYYCAYNHSKMVLNLGVGGGISSTELTNMIQNNIHVSNIKDSNIATFNGIISLGYFISDHLSTDIKYRYLYTLEGDNFDSFGQNSLSFGLRIDF